MNDLIVKIPVKVITCDAIGCNNTLGYFDIKNGRRFCIECRVAGVILWRCATPNCPSIISNSTCRETREICKKCSGLDKE